MAVTYEPIASVTLSTATATVTFGSGGTLPQTYTDLVLVVVAAATSGANSEDTNIRFNGDTGNNYSYTNLEGSETNTPQTYRRPNYPFISELFVGDSGAPRPIIMNIMSYSNSNVFKTVLSVTSVKETFRVGRGVGLWRSTAPITSVTIAPFGTTFESGATASLYGIRAA